MLSKTYTFYEAVHFPFCIWTRDLAAWNRDVLQQWRIQDSVFHLLCVIIPEKLFCKLIESKAARDKFPLFCKLVCAEPNWCRLEQESLCFPSFGLLEAQLSEKTEGMRLLLPTGVIWLMKLQQLLSKKLAGIKVLYLPLLQCHLSFCSVFILHSQPSCDIERGRSRIQLRGKACPGEGIILGPDSAAIWSIWPLLPV